MAKDKKMKIQIDKENVDAKYSDFSIIGKNSLGFNFDFAQRMPGGDNVKVISRLAMSPQHAKIFLHLLRRNIEQYEDKYGEIKIPRKAKQVREDGEIIHFSK